MVEVAEIFRLHGPAYRAQFADRMLPSHLRAMQDIEQCRTAALGGQVYFCNQCQEQRYSYQSCKNRHCPKCGNHQANEWLAAQQELLLPINYFLVTFTLPQELRAVARSNQKTIYNLLFRAASQALLKLALDPRFVGAQKRGPRAGSPRGVLASRHGRGAAHLDPPTPLSSPPAFHRHRRWLK
ncbi:MAG: transposase zinc-binding domain-containing protein [Acidobacteria bacterium]|nr:transposase zinc-binding domain-containing protein [Acidobacteriota bacterium]